MVGHFFSMKWARCPWIRRLNSCEFWKIARLPDLDRTRKKIVNVRLVAATNAPLLSMVEDGRFRKDLYYRLSVVNIYLPPLKERRDDITLLIDHFVKEYIGKYKKEVAGITRRARLSLRNYDWPGNIRQLRNVIERMILMDNDGVLDINDLPEEIAPAGSDDTSIASLSNNGMGNDVLVGRSLSDVEKYYIAKALELTEGKREEAANILGIGERTLYRKIKEYQLN